MFPEEAGMSANNKYTQQAVERFNDNQPVFLRLCLL